MSPDALVTRGTVVAVLTVVAAPADDETTNARVQSPEDARRERINERSLMFRQRPLPFVGVRVRGPRSSAGGSEMCRTEGSEMQRSPLPLDPRNEPPKVESA